MRRYHTFFPYGPTNMGETQAITLDFNDHQFDELSITKDIPWGRLISLNPHYPNQELIGA